MHFRGFGRQLEWSVFHLFDDVALRLASILTEGLYIEIHRRRYIRMSQQFLDHLDIGASRFEQRSVGPAESVPADLLFYP
jgi:hypothetical protein